MKSTILFAFLTIALLASCNTSETPSAPVHTGGGLSIAFVDGDSILMNFKAFRAASETIEAKQRQLEADLQKKGAALEKEIMDYQRKAQSGTLTGKEMEAKERYLTGRQEALLSERDKLAQEMMDETTLINEELKKLLDDKLEKIKKERGFDFILSKVAGGQILLADQKFNITNDVLKMLNEEVIEVPLDSMK